jgi:hypothetical protein
MKCYCRFCAQSAAITLLFVCVIVGTGLSISSPNVASAQSFVFLKNHQLHDKGEDIRALQAFLNALMALRLRNTAPALREMKHPLSVS